MQFRLVMGIAIFGIIATAAGADEVQLIEQARAKRIRELAQSYIVQLDDEKTPAKLQPEPIFRWTNPERGSKGGTLFLWTDQGRPVMTLGIWTYRDIRLSRELQSLYLKPFTARSSDNVNLTPTVAGVEYHELSNSPPPAESAVFRLVQMRKIAADFSATVKRRDRTKPDPLRLLSQPLYRYSEMPTGVTDGALFAFSQGTDPEVFLLLESREAAWHYAFAPSTSGSVKGFHKDMLVWDYRPTSSDTFLIQFFPGE
jgi:hypothetical protein